MRFYGVHSAAQPGKHLPERRLLGGSKVDPHARVDLMLSLELAISTNDGQVNELETRVAAVGVSHFEPANIKRAQGFKSGD